MQRSAVSSQTSLIYIRRSNRDEWSRLHAYGSVCMCVYARLHSARIHLSKQWSVSSSLCSTSQPVFLFPPSTEADISERNDAQMHRLIVWKMQCRFANAWGTLRIIVLRSYHRLSVVIPRATQAALPRSLVI